MNKINIAFIALLFSFCSLHAQDQLSITWRYTDFKQNKTHFDLVLRNNGPKGVDLKDYGLWFNSLYHIKNADLATHSLQDMNGNLYLINLKKDIAVGDSLVIPYETDFGITHTSMAPMGFYLQHKNNQRDVIALQNPTIIAPKLTETENKALLAALFDKNASFHSTETQLILPTPSSIKHTEGTFLRTNGLSIYLDRAFLKALQADLHALEPSFSSMDIYFSQQKDNADVIIEKVEGLEQEEYKLDIDKEKVHIKASYPNGAFYAMQSLKSLLPADYLSKPSNTLQLPLVEVHDRPRYSYRGLMLDISRNFRDLNTLKKYLDIMALYKLNTLHLHFIDDEGWRLEIPSLPELTTIGAERNPFFEDGNSLQPAYGSGAEPLKKQYLTKREFKELLRYAADRFITVVPEVETPGHARASVKAMEKRYHNLLAQGNKVEAERFLMNDFADTSHYFSAQYWQDNVMNPAMPGTYNFIAHILDELKNMYNEVGLTLEKVSLGGDELPAGAWEGSPKVQALMQEKGMKTVHEVWPYYIDKVHHICAEKGLVMAGWEEIGMVNKGEGMVVNESLNDRNFQLDVWNNTIGGGQEDLAYRLANAGYKTVFISASNYYFDMVWDNHFEEPGLTWASKTDLYHSYSLIPEDYFANILFTERGKPLGKEYFDNKIRITETGKQNFIGLKGALWSETVNSDERLDYMIFPRFFALAERAWAPKRPWESESNFNKEEFDRTYAAFTEKVGKVELQKFNHLHGGIGYRLPAVGLKESDGKILANAEYPGFTIWYTLDGSVPSIQSPEFPAEGLSIKPGQTLKAACSSDHANTGRVSTYVQ